MPSRSALRNLALLLIAVMAVTACGGGKGTKSPTPSLATPEPTAEPSPSPTPDLTGLAADFDRITSDLEEARNAAFEAFYTVPEADPKHLAVVWTQLDAAYRTAIADLRDLQFPTTALANANAIYANYLTGILADVDKMIADPFDTTIEVHLRSQWQATLSDSLGLLREELGLPPATPFRTTSYTASPMLNVGTVATVYDEDSDGTRSFVPIGTVGLRYAQWSTWVATVDSPTRTPPYLALMVEFHEISSSFSYCYDNGWQMKQGDTVLTWTPLVNKDHKFDIPVKTLGCDILSKPGYLRAWLIYRPNPNGAQKLTVAYHRDWIDQPYFSYSFNLDGSSTSNETPAPAPSEEPSAEPAS